jgi:hypothetical protein
LINEKSRNTGAGVGVHGVATLGPNLPIGCPAGIINTSWLDPMIDLRLNGCQCQQNCPLWFSETQIHSKITVLEAELAN